MGGYLKAGMQRESPAITVSLLTVLQGVRHMHIYCLQINVATCFPGFSMCC